MERGCSRLNSSEFGLDRVLRVSMTLPASSQTWITAYPVTAYSAPPSDCMADRIPLAVSQPTQMAGHGEQIDAAFVFADTSRSAAEIADVSCSTVSRDPGKNALLPHELSLDSTAQCPASAIGRSKNDYGITRPSIEGAWRFRRTRFRTLGFI